MKYPLDKICVKSGVLCPSCQRKVESGLVSEDDIGVMKSLMDVEEELKFLGRKGEYVRSIRGPDSTIIVLRGDFEISELQELEKALSDKLDTRVKVVVETGDAKKLVEQIIAPASLLGLNKVWLPTGVEIVNVRVPKRDMRFLGKRVGEYESILSKMLGVETHIVFE